jgi:hypothetical protein
MNPTLVLIGHREINGQQFQHGDELPPDLLPPEVVDWWLDHKWLEEYPERRSLYRIFSVFSGAKEQEQLDDGEMTALALPN